MARSQSPSSASARAHAVFLNLALPPYGIHFRVSDYFQPHTLDLLDRKVAKDVLKATASNHAVREAIGTDKKFWEEFTAVLRDAIVSFERRSFSIWDPSGVDYESTSGSLIAGHYPLLWKDLERLHDLLSISRNVLTIGPRAQDLAAATYIDGLVCHLIHICVRVTARGYDGEAGTGEEEKWQIVVGSFKKVLITSLQWVNNFVARNESRRVGMWIRLFEPGNESEGRTAEDAQSKEEALEQQRREIEAAEARRPEPPINNQDILLAYGMCGTSRLSPLEMEAAQPMYKDEGFLPLPSQAQRHIKNQEPSTWVFFVHLYRQRCVEDFTREHKRAPMLAEIHKNIPRYWHELVTNEGKGNSEKQLWAQWMRKYGEALRQHRDELAAWEDDKARPRQKALPPSKASVAKQEPSPVDPDQVEQRILELQDQLAERYRTESANMPSLGQPDPVLEGPEVASKAAEKDDLSMPFTADAGAKILESGKLELMKRLEGYPPEHPAASATTLPERTRSLSPRVPAPVNGEPAKRVGSDPTAERPSTGVSGLEVEDAFAEESLDEEEEDESEDAEEDEEDDEDYPGSTEDGRGLLTDVPLILGPSEIEVLPMLIMSGIVPTSPNPKPGDTPTSHLADHNVPVLLTHLLLSTPSGLNLLRELLIFVAAWDLREEELYFKFMVKIIEAILQAGLLPYAYHAFRDRSRSRDIISPAQALVMKLLTCIFRGRTTELKAKQPTPPSPNAPVNGYTPPTKVELHVLNFIFAEFRQHIIPQTCALIFLQGQIHKGRASPEDFPLNLWDMERMYEGVYQYLEFFAVLTEESQREAFLREGVLERYDGRKRDDEEEDLWSWKKILADWEMSRELVTLLRELEGGIPRVGPQGGSVTLPGIELPPRAQQRRVSAPSHPQRSMSADAATMPPPVAVERPYDVHDNGITLPSLPSATGHDPMFEPEHPLAYPDDQPPSTSAGIGDHDEPSDFEWKNLKKLAVLVLSSLAWKQPQVQKQVREAGGLETLVSCCRPDGNNPWIRDHAIMCLRFATDGCEENIAVLAGMDSSRRALMGDVDSMLGGGATAGGSAVPKEVLDTNGYETFVDGKGQVGLRRKAATSSSHPTPSSSSTAQLPKPPRLGATTKMTAEKAAELMQNALRDLPLGDQLVTDRQKVEALARLDRAFESTEVALGGAGLGSLAGLGGGGGGGKKK